MDFKIITYVDSIGCASCKLQLHRWKELIAEVDSVTSGTVPFLFYFHPKDMKELRYLTRRDDFIYPVIIEAKLPIQFNKDGDALLTNTFVDFDAEYSSSHKLLLQYVKSKNLEGIKYELARLYYMNYILERRLYHNKFLTNKEKNIRTRARVLNDFKKYLDYLLKEDPGFNFSEYYEKSEFYPHTVEVKSGTILKLKD